MMVMLAGYGVEYEVFDAVLLKRTLELKSLPRLFVGCPTHLMNIQSVYND